MANKKEPSNIVPFRHKTFTAEDVSFKAFARSDITAYFYAHFQKPFRIYVYVPALNESSR